MKGINEVNVAIIIIIYNTIIAIQYSDLATSVYEGTPEKRCKRVLHSLIVFPGKPK